MLVFAPILACALRFDEISLIQADDATQGAPLFAAQYEPASTGTVVAGAKHSYLKFFAAKGKNAVLDVTAADIDGNGQDEYVVLRKVKKTGSKALVVVAQPDVLGAKAPKVIASSAKGSLSESEVAGVVAALGAIDYDGDSIDELLLLRDHLDGRQEVDLVRAPLTKKDDLEAPLAILTVTEPGEDRARAVFSVRASAVPDADALVLVREAANGALRLELHAMPGSTMGAIEPPILVAPIDVIGGDTWIDASRGADEDPGILLAFRRENGSSRLSHVLVDGAFGVVDRSQNFPNYGATIRHIVALRTIDEPEPPVLAPLKFHVGVPVGAGTTTLYLPAGTGSALLQPNGDYSVVRPDGGVMILRPLAPTSSEYTPIPAVFSWQFVDAVSGVGGQVSLDLTGRTLTSNGTPEEPRFYCSTYGDSFGTITPSPLMTDSSPIRGWILGEL